MDPAPGTPKELRVTYTIDGSAPQQVVAAENTELRIGGGMVPQQAYPQPAYPQPAYPQPVAQGYPVPVAGGGGYYPQQQQQAGLPMPYR